VEGRWLVAGQPSQCTGLSTADCEGFRTRGASFRLRIVCNGEECSAIVGTSKAVPLVVEGATFRAEGVLNDVDGFSCEGQPDPTTYEVVIDAPEGDERVDTFTAVVSLHSPGTETDGLSCVDEVLVAHTTAARQA
jgi:hypothetical protein